MGRCRVLNRPERLFALASAAYLVVWLGWSLLVGIGGGVRPFLLGALGFAGMLIFGFSYHMFPRFWSRRYHGVGPKYLHLVLANVGLVGMFLSDSVVFPVLWLVGVVVYLWVLSRSRYGEEVRIKEVRLDSSVDRVSAGFLVVAAGYLVAASVLMFFELSPRVLHLVLPGFVMNVIFGFFFRMVTLFLGGRPWVSVASVHLGASAVGPGLVAYGVFDGSVLVLGAVAEFLVAVLFAVNLVRVYRTGSRQKKPHRFLLASIAFLVLGVLMGALFAVEPSLRSSLRGAHGWVNGFGFVAMFVFGVSYQTLIGYWKRGNVVVRNRGNIHLALSLGGLVPLVLTEAGVLPPELWRIFLLPMFLGVIIWAVGIVSVVWTMEKKGAF